MRLFKRGNGRSGTLRGGGQADLEHLAEFVRTRPGVEAFLEPRTAVTQTTVILIAASGEWTRRRVDGERGAAAFARKHHLPLYDIAATGYPQRMRDWNARTKS